MIRKIAFTILALLVGCTSAPLHRAQERDPSLMTWTDVHVHLSRTRSRRMDLTGPLSAAVKAAEADGIRKIVIMPPPFAGEGQYYDVENFAQDLAPFKDRVAFLGGGGSLNSILHDAADESKMTDSVRTKFADTAEAILRSGASGFGEIALLHLSRSNAHPFENVRADHPLLILLSDIAARHESLIDIHMDLVETERALPEGLSSPPNPARLQPNLEAFEKLLAHNRAAKFVWAHAGSDSLGQWTPELTRKLLVKHSNLYMSLRMWPMGARRNHPLNDDGKIRPSWRSIFTEFPDRFVLGSDQFFTSNSGVRTGFGHGHSKRSSEARQRSDELLKQLPPEVARKIAWENAARIYKFGAP